MMSVGKTIEPGRTVMQCSANISIVLLIMLLSGGLIALHAHIDEKRF